jgi:hypothetical protein
MTREFLICDTPGRTPLATLKLLIGNTPDLI